MCSARTGDYEDPERTQPGEEFYDEINGERGVHPPTRIFEADVWTVRPSTLGEINPIQFEGHPVFEHDELEINNDSGDCEETES